MAKDRSFDIEKNIKRRFEEMEQTLITIQQKHAATTEFQQWRLQPTDWNARNTTPIEVSAYLQREEADYSYGKQTQQAITTSKSSSKTITNHFDWRPGFVFRTHCVIKDIKACRLVLYGGNNIVSKGLVERLKLKTRKKYPSVRVRVKREEDKVAEETCEVPVSIGEYYKDEVNCYVVNMEEEEEDQLLFGGPWLYRVQATHDARDNSCMIIWNHTQFYCNRKCKKTKPYSSHKSQPNIVFFICYISLY